MHTDRKHILRWASETDLRRRTMGKWTTDSGAGLSGRISAIKRPQEPPGQKTTLAQVFVEARNYHMIGMYFMIKRFIRVS